MPIVLSIVIPVYNEADGLPALFEELNRVLEGRLVAEARGKFSFRITAAPDAKPGVKLIAFDITRDGVRQGELFDAILEIEPARP